MLRDPRIEITLEVLAMLVPFVPGFLISWLVLHWHGVALIAVTIGLGVLLAWAIVKLVHWLGARERETPTSSVASLHFLFTNKNKSQPFGKRRLKTRG